MRSQNLYDRRYALKTRSGFTLIELMVALAVVAILAAIALPNYTAYVVRGHRAAAKSQMMDIATREQQYLLANRRYATADELNFTLPSEVSERYEWDVTVNDEGDPPSFLITFIAIAAQEDDGVLTLDNVGNKTPLEKWQK